MGSEVHQPLDVHGHFAPQIALDRELGRSVERDPPFDLRLGESFTLVPGLTPASRVQTLASGALPSP